MTSTSAPVRSPHRVVPMEAPRGLTTKEGQLRPHQGVPGGPHRAQGRFRSSEGWRGRTRRPPARVHTWQGGWVEKKDKRCRQAPKYEIHKLIFSSLSSQTVPKIFFPSECSSSCLKKGPLKFLALLSASSRRTLFPSAAPTGLLLVPLFRCHVL